MSVDANDDAWAFRERGLVAAAKRGDSQAVAELYRAFAGRLYSQVLMPRLGNHAAAEDALSETFRAALEKLDRFDPERGVSIYFWLSRIAMNKATDMHRSRSRTTRALTNFEELVKPLRPAAIGPGDRLEESERLRRIQSAVSQALSAVNPRYRKAIRLRFIDERSREDCAQEMQVKLGTFDVLLLRALRAFRREWDRTIRGTELSEQRA